jgi:hypothetical protein
VRDDAGLAGRTPPRLRRHSAFHALHHASGRSLLLDDQYRCHTAIANPGSTRLSSRQRGVAEVHADRQVSLPARHRFDRDRSWQCGAQSGRPGGSLPGEGPQGEGRDR